MLVSEAHKELGLAGHFADRQSAFVQYLSHIQEDDGVYYVAEYRSPDSIDRPFGQRQEAEILLVLQSSIFLWGVKHIVTLPLESIERVVVNNVGKRRGVHVTTLTEDSIDFSIRENVNATPDRRSSLRETSSKLSEMELSSILHVLCGAASENIFFSVPHQFLNSNKCHVGVSYNVVLSSTIDLGIIFVTTQVPLT